MLDSLRRTHGKDGTLSGSGLAGVTVSMWFGDGSSMIEASNISVDEVVGGFSHLFDSYVVLLLLFDELGVSNVVLPVVGYGAVGYESGGRGSYRSETQ